ncbi:MAG: hypothetical protein KC550_00455, partial [Nanoarchaeota archaeon]|nr:hypothetical protein [Nanoarchaeota archaeon]
KSEVTCIDENFMFNPNLENKVFRLQNGKLILGRELGSLENGLSRALLWKNLNFENAFYLVNAYKQKNAKGKITNIRSQIGIVEKFELGYLKFPKLNEVSFGVYQNSNEIEYTFIKHDEEGVRVNWDYLKIDDKVDFCEELIGIGDNLVTNRNPYFLSQTIYSGNEAKERFDELSGKKDKFFKRIFKKIGYK